MKIITKLKFKSDIFECSNKFIFYNFFSIYIKMFTNLLAKYYQENRERVKKSSWKISKSFWNKKKRKKSNNMLVKVTKISQKMKKINWLGIETTSRWRLKRLRAKYPPKSEQPTTSVSYKPRESRDIDFSNSQVTSCWSLDQRVMFGSLLH